MNFHVLLLVQKDEAFYLKESIESILRNEIFARQLTVFLPKEVVYKPKPNVEYQTYEAGNKVSVLLQIKTWLTQQAAADAYLFMHAGIVIPEKIDERLLDFIENAPLDQAFTISPYCLDNLFPPLHIGQTDSTLPETDALLYLLSQKNYFQIPFFYYRCFCINQKALNLLISNIALLENEKVTIKFYWELSQLSAMQGCAHFFIDYFYVKNYVKNNNSSEKDFLLKQPSVKVFSGNHPSLSLEHEMRVLENFDANYKHYALIKKAPAQLHLIHDWDGGLGRWAHDYCQYDKDRINLILRPSGTPGIFGAYGQEFTLYIYARDKIVLRKWRLSSPINTTDVSNTGYKLLLEEIIRDYKISTILVSSLIGHSLDILKTTLPTIFICHDYYPFCQAIHIYYNGTCQQCDKERLTNCNKNNPENFLFKKNTPNEWLALRQSFSALIAQEKITLVYPTLSVKTNYERLEPTFKNIHSTIISHGIKLVSHHSEHHFSLAKFLNINTDSNSFKIIILGRLSVLKGLNLLKKVYAKLEQGTQLFLIGCGEEAADLFAGKKNIYIMPSYESETLSSIIKKINPHIGLLLSIVPETFSYTLSELMLLEVPVLATNSGSFSDRIEDNINGFLCEPLPSIIFEKINYLKNHPDEIKKVKSLLATTSYKSVEEMIGEYHEILPVKPRETFTKITHNISSVAVSLTEIAKHVLSIPVQENFSSIPSLLEDESTENAEKQAERKAQDKLDIIYQSLSWRITRPLRATKNMYMKIEKIFGSSSSAFNEKFSKKSAQARLDEMYQSTSWRITRPLRFVKRLLKKLIKTCT